MTIRETSFRENDHPGNIFPGNVSSGKKTIRESYNPGNDCKPYKQLHGSEPSTVQRTQLGFTTALLTQMDRAVNKSTIPHLYHVHLSNYSFANI